MSKDPITTIFKAATTLTATIISLTIIHFAILGMNAEDTGTVIEKYYTDNAFNTYCTVKIESQSSILSLEKQHVQKYYVPYQKFKEIKIGETVKTKLSTNPIKAAFGIRLIVEEEENTDVRKTTQDRHHDSTNDYEDGKINNQPRKTDNGTGGETR